MKYALICGKKTVATKGARGICPCCASEVIAKCGSKRINHWAHKKDSNCDSWWENETEWHRAWKEHFPVEWQEVVHTGDDGEKHIADVQLSNGLVIEFQHSSIDPEERAARENFYKNMIWVVDGTRLKRDYPRFLNVRNDVRPTNLNGYYLVDFPEKYFPSDWLDSKVPIIFDFLGTESIDDADEYKLRNDLYCLFPEQYHGKTVLANYSRESFIEKANKGELSLKLQESQEPQKQSEKSPIQKKRIKRRSWPSYFYNPRTKKLVKRKRL